MKNNLIEKIIVHFGGQLATAQALSVTQPAVSGWLRGSHGVSAVVAIRIERISNGQFKAADICTDLAA